MRHVLALSVLVLSMASSVGTLEAQNVSNFHCDPAFTGNPDEYLLTWTLPTGTTLTDIRIFENNALIAILPGSATEFSSVYTGTPSDSCATAPPIGLGSGIATGVVPVLCIQTTNAGGVTSGLNCCFPLFNLTTTDGVSLAGSCDPGPDPDDQIYGDHWFCFDAPASMPVVFSLVAPDGLRTAVYEGCACPPDPTDVIACDEGDSATGVGPLLIFDAIAGNSYLFRVGGDAPGIPFIAAYLLEYYVPPPQNVACDTAVPSQVTVSWTIPPGANYDGGINLYREGALIASLSGTSTSFTEVLAAPIQGIEDFCVEGVDLAVGASDQACCSVITAPANDACAFQQPLFLGSTFVETAAATTDGADLTGFCNPGTLVTDQIYNDVWYCFNAPATGFVSLEASSFANARFAVYQGCACPDDPALVLGCAETVGSVDLLEFSVTAGQNYLLRIGSTDPTLQVTAWFGLEYVTRPVEGLSCGVGFQGQVALTWNLPAGQPYDGGINVYWSGALVAVLPGTETSFVYAGGPASPPMTSLCVEGVSLIAGPSAQVCCSPLISNDDCSNALPVGLGTTFFDTSFASLSLMPVSLCGPFGSDLWFRFVPTATQAHTISLCGSSFDTLLAVWEFNGSCTSLPAVEIACSDDACGDQSQVVANLVAGTEYILQVAAPPAVFGGPGVLEISDCAGVNSLVCDFDCGSGVVQLSWAASAAYSSIEVLANGVVVASGLAGGASSFIDSNPPPGLTVYTVEATCAAGGVSSTDCAVDVTPLSAAGTDLILNLELPGVVDSAAALEAALIANGRTVSTFSQPGFDANPCFDALAGAASRIWVLTGSFPSMFFLTPSESDLLAQYAAQGKGLYLEGSALWSIGQVPGALEDRDGIDESQIVNSSLLVDEVDGQLAPLVGIDLSGSQDVPRASDQPFGDFVDELVLDVGFADPSVMIAEVLWRNSANTAGEVASVATVAAVHLDGGVMISSSVEFGSIGSPSLREQVVAAYLGAFGTPPTVEAFQRGDCNDDGSTNIADVIHLLGNLFPQGTPNPIECVDACDGNDDGLFNLGDSVTILGALFGTPSVPLPDPASACGVDSTSDGLDCALFNGC